MDNMLYAGMMAIIAFVLIGVGLSKEGKGNPSKTYFFLMISGFVTMLLSLYPAKTQFSETFKVLSGQDIEMTPFQLDVSTVSALVFFLIGAAAVIYGLLKQEKLEEKRKINGEPN